MDPARRWQVASVVTAAASLGLGAFTMQRPSSEAVEPIDLDVLAAAPDQRSEPWPSLSASHDAMIVTPDLLERVPTPPSAASTATPVSIDSPPEPPTDPPTDPATGPTTEPAPAPSPTGSSPASVASPDDTDDTDEAVEANERSGGNEPAEAAGANPAPTAEASADSPAEVDSPASIDS